MLPLWNFLFSSNEQKTKINVAQGGVSFNGVTYILTTGMTWVTPSPLSMTVPVSVLSPTCLDVQEAARASTACHAHIHMGMSHTSQYVHTSAVLVIVTHCCELNMVTWSHDMKSYSKQTCYNWTFQIPPYMTIFCSHTEARLCLYNRTKKCYIKSILNKIHLRISSFALCWTESQTKISVSVWARHTGTDTC